MTFRPLLPRLFLAARASLVLLALAPAIRAADTPPLPPDSDYVVPRGPHLYLNGERVRYWGLIGQTVELPDVKAGDSAEARQKKAELAHKGNELRVERYSQMGFNALRLWHVAVDADYQPGDGSRADAIDHFVAEAKRRGFRLWTAGLNSSGRITPADVAIVDDPATSAAWQAAVLEWAQQGKKEPVVQSLPGAPEDQRKFALSLGNLARVWDPRFEAMLLRNMRRVADHRNKHTGLRWADDPVFAVWELSNEEWWVRKMLAGTWQQYPAFFRNTLVARWNAWLKNEYKDEAALRAAWKDLLPGESLDGGTILFAPMAGNVQVAGALNDDNPAARAALQGLKQAYGPADFAPARASDVLRFLVQIQLEHKKRLAAEVKTWGKAIRLGTLVWDTGIGYHIQSQYLHQESDAVTHAGYTNGWGPPFVDRDFSKEPVEQQRLVGRLGDERISANSGKWVNWLLKPPALAQGAPWLELGRHPDKPFLAYETQLQQPAKYRADYPLRVLAAASIQEWDWVNWHYYGPIGNPATGGPEVFDGAMDYKSGTHPQGYHFTYDEVQTAMMRAAGLAFREHAFKAPGNPTTFIFGRKSLYDPVSMRINGSYGVGGLDQLQTLYQYGHRIVIDPTREDDAVIGPVVKFADRHKHNPYTPTPEITFDWKKGVLVLDSPEFAGFTGLLARYGKEVEFSSGVVLRDVKLINPPNISDPVGDDEKYIAFALHSTDGQALAKAKRASLSLVSTSFNDGWEQGPEGFAVRGKTGRAPALVVRVGGTVVAPALAGMRYTMRDWLLKPLGQGVVGKDGRLVVPADKPVFVVELER